MYLYGASGHAKVIIEILERENKQIRGIFDDNRSIKALFDVDVEPFPGAYHKKEHQLIISIGNNRIRKKVSENIDAFYGTAIHPFTSISIRSAIGEGTVVMAGVVVNANVTIGRHCIINTNASVDHDCIIEDFVHISPNTALCGSISVGEGTHIGAGAVIIPGVSIGKWCNIGAGAVVIRNVPDFSTAVGNPARIIKTNELI